MRDPSAASSVRRLIMLVALAALVLFAFVAQPQDEYTLELGVAIIGSSILAMAIATFIARARELRASGTPVARLGWICLALRSLVASATSILVSIFAFLTLYFFSELLRPKPSHDRFEIRHPSLALGIIGALVVARRLRPFLWAHGGTRPKLRRLWPVAAVALIGMTLLSVMWKERWEYCREMARYHAEAEKSATDPETAWRHSWMRKEFERRAWRPWVPDRPVYFPPRPGTR